MNETTIGTELTLNELDQIHGGKGFFETVYEAGKWVVKHVDDIKKVVNAAKSVWNTVKGWF